MTHVQNNELTHHGIVGQKWGVRRTPEQLGRGGSTGKRKKSIVEAKISKMAKKREAAAAVKKQKAEEKKKAEEAKKVEKKKNVKDMSEDELRERINRLDLERRYLDLQRQVDSFGPKEVSMGKKIAKSVLNETVAPAMKNAGRQLLEPILKNKGAELLGLKNKDSGFAISELEKSVRRMTLERRQNELIKYFKDAGLDLPINPAYSGISIDQMIDTGKNFVIELLKNGDGD